MQLKFNSVSQCVISIVINYNRGRLMVEGKLFKKLIEGKFQKCFTALAGLIELEGICHYYWYPSDKVVFNSVISNMQTKLVAPYILGWST